MFVIDLFFVAAHDRGRIRSALPAPTVWPASQKRCDSHHKKAFSLFMKKSKKTIFFNYLAGLFKSAGRRGDGARGAGRTPPVEGGRRPVWHTDCRN